MKFSKQALLGTTVLLGGSVLLYATMHQVLNTPAKSAAKSQQVIAKPTTDKQSAISNEPLTADIATEKNLLAQKQKANRQLHRPIRPTGSRRNHLHARPEAGCYPLL